MSLPNKDNVLNWTWKSYLITAVLNHCLDGPYHKIGTFKKIKLLGWGFPVKIAFCFTCIGQCHWLHIFFCDIPLLVSAWKLVTYGHFNLNVVRMLANTDWYKYVLVNVTVAYLFYVVCILSQQLTLLCILCESCSCASQACTQQHQHTSHHPWPGETSCITYRCYQDTASTMIIMLSSAFLLYQTSLLDN